MLTNHLGVQFLYQEPEQPMSEEHSVLDLSDLPAEWYTELRQAVTEADSHKIVALAKRIRSQRPALTATLIKLANNFDYDSILAAIDQLK
jgi:HD-like signal output (HDOD) protein